LKRLLLVAVLTCVAIALLAPVAQAANYNQTIDKLMANGYPQKIDRHIASLGSSWLGMRYAGSSSDNEGARYIAKQMRKLLEEEIFEFLKRQPKAEQTN
jgi:hypothetical protein